MARPKKALVKTNTFLRSRKPGRFSPKSRLLYTQAGPTFAHMSPQQQKIKAAGIKCGSEIRGKYPGSGGVKQRRTAMGACIRREFGY